MFKIEGHKQIDRIISVFYFIGLWHGNRNVFCNWASKIWHIVVYVYYPIALLLGGLISDNETERVFLGVVGIVTVVLSVRFYYIIWKKDEIVGFIREIGTFSMTDNGEFNEVNNNIKGFMKFVSYLEFVLLCAVIGLSIVSLPIFSNEKHLPFNIYFPLDWKQSEVVYWIAYIFVMYEVVLSWMCTLFNVIVWYLMMSCATKYKLLGNKFRKMGFDGRTLISVSGKQDLFLEELIELIKDHQNLQKYKTF